MNRLIFAAAAMVSASVVLTAYAEIPQPPESNFEAITLDGADAHDLYLNLNVPANNESANRTFATSYKLIRDTQGLSEILCKVTVSAAVENNKGPTDAFCSITKSKDGKPVPTYVPHRVGG